MVEPSEIGDQFFNELSKREQGRQACLDAGCGYFMSIDVDEFYVAVRSCPSRSIRPHQ